MVNQQRPYISQENVRKALSALIHPTGSPQLTALTSLVMVDEFLLSPDFPSTNKARDFALNRLLTETIADEYGRIRGIHTAIPLEIHNRDRAIEHISADAAYSSGELSAWGWLYYHFVRVDLSISTSDFSHAAGVDKRTLRRIQQVGVERLMDHLIDKEWQARALKRARWLLSELPLTISPQLIGRDAEIVIAEKILIGEQPAHLLLTGMPGIGKTSLALYLLHQQIALNAIDHVVWINEPRSVDFIYDRLSERLLPQEGRVSLQEYASVYRVAVVIDDADSLFEEEIDALDVLLQSLSHMLIIIIGDVRVEGKLSTTHQVMLRELDADSAAQLAEMSFKKAGVDAELEFDYAYSGGNPSAIQLATQRAQQFTGNDSRSLEKLLASSLDKLDHATRACWYVLSLLPPATVNLLELTAIWPSLVTRTALEKLAKYFLVDVDHAEHGNGSLPSVCRHYIKALYQISPDVSATLDIALSVFDAIPHSHEKLLLDILENLLLSDNWLSISTAKQEEWIARWFAKAMTHKRWAAWRSIFQKHLDDLTLEQRTAYGGCLRSLGRWDDAEREFEFVIRAAGQSGYFEQQAQTMLEKAILLRSRGNYRDALNLLARAARIAGRRNEIDLIYAINLEYMQVGLDLHDLETCRDLVDRLPQGESAHLLQGEYYLQRGDWQKCLDHTQSVLNNPDLPQSSQARALNTLGQLYFGQGEAETAYFYLSRAIMLLENLEEPFALARAQSNLSALCIQMGNLGNAQVLLLEAEKTQNLIHDAVGLSATKHNFNALMDAFSQLTRR